MSNQDGNIVFFVDDESDVCRAVAITLERALHNTQTFTSPLACLKALENTPCDLLICDVKMAEMNGLDLLHQAKKIRPKLPVIVLTAYADVPMAVQAMKEGAVDFVEKPLDRNTFLDAVNAALTLEQHLPASEPLTRAEQRVLKFIIEGKSNRHIAHILHRSHRTIEDHRNHIMQKLGVTNIVELMNIVLAHKSSPPKAKTPRNLPTKN